MMRKILFPIAVFLLIIYAVCGCKKKSSQNASPVKVDSTNSATAKADSAYARVQKILAANTSKIGDTRVWIGLGGAFCKYNNSCTIFFNFQLSVVNDSTLIGYYADTVRYASVDTGTTTITFKGSYPSGSCSTCGTFETITFNYSSGAITDDCMFGSSCFTEMSIRTVTNAPTTSLEDLLPKIAGTRIWSVTCDDFFIMRSTPDSVYNITYSFGLIVVDDSTIKTSGNPLQNGEITFHYKSTDPVANTVTFQQYCDLTTLPDSAALTINYVTNSVYLENYTWETGMYKYTKLQGK